MNTTAKRKLLPELELDFFEVHQPIVYGCLRSLGIYLNNSNYDDFKQIGFLALVEAYEAFPQSMLEEEAFYQFTGFAFQKVKWKILDEMRRTNRIYEQEISIEKEELDRINNPVFLQEERRLLFLMLESLMEHLNQNEQEYLFETVINQRTVTEFAKLKGVSRKTVYEWKKNIARKLKNYKHMIRGYE